MPSQKDQDATATVVAGHTVTAATQTATVFFSQVTADTFPNVAGNYSGTYQVQGAKASTAMQLVVTTESTGLFTGTCILGSQSYPIQHGRTTFAGNGLDFDIAMPSGTSDSVVSTISFSGIQLSDGTLLGDFVATSGQHGTWSVKKV